LPVGREKEFFSIRRKKREEGKKGRIHVAQSATIKERKKEPNHYHY